MHPSARKILGGTGVLGADQDTSLFTHYTPWPREGAVPTSAMAVELTSAAEVAAEEQRQQLSLLLLVSVKALNSKKHLKGTHRWQKV